MQKLFKLPLVFLFIAAGIGLLLRWHFISPVGWLNYPFWLHGHSHIMFLGWVFNALYLAYVYNHVPTTTHKRYKTLFIVIQVLLVGMLISFPLQGYALFSITFSTLHIIAVAIYCIWFFKDSKKMTGTPSLWFAKLSLIFFLISAIGPFSLAPIMASGLAHSNLYYLAIYFYLHFQYNGVFTFGVLALFFHLLDEKQILFSPEKVKTAAIILFAACFPAYLLSTLWTNPGIVFNIVGAASALSQIVALFYLMPFVSSVSKDDGTKFSLSSKWLLIVSFSALAAKFLLQLLSAHPQIAQLAYEIRYYIIAYLHLVLIGFITLFLVAWYIEKRIIQVNRIVIYLLVIGFAGSELIIVLTPSLGSMLNSASLIFIFSLLLTLGICGLLLKNRM